MPRQTATIDTADGSAPANFFVPDGGSPRGVILYMDAFGPRPALDHMAERLSALGYAVLVPDLFYRHGAYGPFDARTAFKEEANATKIRAMMGATSQAMTQADTGAFLDWMVTQGVTGPVGTVGYCMGGGRAINAAAAWPDRIVAAASFHGGNLGSDQPDAPHRNAGKLKTIRLYVGMASVDGSYPVAQSTRFAEALRAAEVDHTIENYVGMQHGWCVPDHGVFDKNGAERHWARLATLYSEAMPG